MFCMVMAESRMISTLVLYTGCCSTARPYYGDGGAGWAIEVILGFSTFRWRYRVGTRVRVSLQEQRPYKETACRSMR